MKPNTINRRFKYTSHHVAVSHHICPPRNRQLQLKSNSSGPNTLNEKVLTMHSDSPKNLPSSVSQEQGGTPVINCAWQVRPHPFQSTSPTSTFSEVPLLCKKSWGALKISVTTENMMDYGLDTGTVPWLSLGTILTFYVNDFFSLFLIKKKVTALNSQNIF